MDSEERSRKIVLESGGTSAVHGGFKIRVIDPSSFPWCEVFNQLIEISQEDWIHKNTHKIYINTNALSKVSLRGMK